MGLRWVTTTLAASQQVDQGLEGGEKPQLLPPRFIIKTDDDVFIEIFHLERFINAIYGRNPE